MTCNYRNLKVLIADDTAFLRSSLIKFLIEMGIERHNIQEFDNGKVAYDSIKNLNVKYDIILSDWNMPVLNGLEFLKAIRSSGEYFKEIPFVLITTVSEREKIIEALNYKVTAYLLKPIKSEKLIETFIKVFGPKDS